MTMQKKILSRILFRTATRIIFKYYMMNDIKLKKKKNSGKGQRWNEIMWTLIFAQQLLECTRDYAFIF